MPSKPWYMSKTMWLNIGALVVVILQTVISIVNGGPVSLEGDWQQLGTIIVLILNMILRMGTNVTLTK